MDAGRGRRARPVVAAHPRRGDDGRIRSQGAFGRGHARRRDVRAPRVARRSIDAIIKLAEQAAKDPWELAEQADDSRPLKAKLKKLIGNGHRRRLQADRQVGAPERAQRRPRQGQGRPSPTPTPQDQHGRQQAGEEARGRDRPRRDPQGRPPHRRPRHQTRSARSRRWSASCRAPTARRCSPAARPRRSAPPRSAPRTAEQMIDGLNGLSYEHFMLHYNFPPYSVGEVGRFGAPGAPRSRPRQARLARAAPGAADQGGVPLHDPRPLRHHRVQRLLVDGDGVRRLAGDDGRRRADQAPGLAASPWA